MANDWEANARLNASMDKDSPLGHVGGRYDAFWTAAGLVIWCLVFFAIIVSWIVFGPAVIVITFLFMGVALILRAVLGIVVEWLCAGEGGDE